jgi:hypothetical protein
LRIAPAAIAFTVEFSAVLLYVIGVAAARLPAAGTLLLLLLAAAARLPALLPAAFALRAARHGFRLVFPAVLGHCKPPSKWLLSTYRRRAEYLRRPRTA